MDIKEKKYQFSELLLEYNKKVNLISRKVTKRELFQLLDESDYLNKYIDKKIIIDAGSGNGILGIPIAFLNKEKNIVLVETKQKKINFLKQAKEELCISNLDIQETGIVEYVRKIKKGDIKNITLIARGFPRLDILIELVKKGKISEAVIVTSENKIKKNQIPLENMEKKIYNIPLRKNLKILKITS